MSDIVIKAENLVKKYTIGRQAERSRCLALRDLLRGKPIIQGNDLEEVWVRDPARGNRRTFATTACIELREEANA